MFEERIHIKTFTRLINQEKSFDYKHVPAFYSPDDFNKNFSEHKYLKAFVMKGK